MPSNKKLSELLNKFLEDSKNVFKEDGFNGQSISEIHLKGPKENSEAANADDNDEDNKIVCKFVKKGNKEELVCKKAKDWK